MADILTLKQKLDSKNIYAMIEAMPLHLGEGMAIAGATNMERLEGLAFSSIVVAGMGGSAIAGDIARSYLYNSLPVPFLVCRHYRLPAFAGNDALVICSSYSGNTEETISAYDNAKSKGARLMVIASGGTLAEKAQADGIPFVKIPGGLPPRAALGYSFSALLTMISRLGFGAEINAELPNVISSLQEWNSRYNPENDSNPALKLARELYGTIPIIYTGYERLDAVATRFRGQVNENAKTLAFINVFPELNHNEIVGWNKLHGLDKKFTVIMLGDKQDHSRVKARMDIVSEYLIQKGIRVITLESQGRLDLERIFYFIQYLDFTSYYLALLNDVDPYPVTAIDYLKDKLAKMN